jgi:hypothetical protein
LAARGYLTRRFELVVEHFAGVQWARMAKRAALIGWGLVAGACHSPPAPERPPPAACSGSGEVSLSDVAIERIVLDDTHVYFIDDRGDIWRADPSAPQPSRVASALRSPSRQALAVDETHVYFAIPDGVWYGPAGLYRVTKTGGQPDRILTTDSEVRELVVDDGDAFFLTNSRVPGGALLLRVDLASGEQTIVADAGVIAFAVDGDALFWGRRDRLNASDRAGAQLHELTRVEGMAGPIRPTPEHVYYFDDEAGVVRVPRSGGTTQLVVAFAGDEAFGFEVVGEHVYWTSSDGTLSRSPATPGATSELLEQRGSFDDDDYRPLLEVDAMRIYWQAGPVVGEHRSDREPLGLYYRCL